MIRASLLKPNYRPQRARRKLRPWFADVQRYLSETGKQRQLYYDTQNDAEIVCERYRNKKEYFGVKLAAALGPRQISEAAECYERLEPYQVTLLHVVNEYIQARKQRDASISFLNLA